MDLTSSLGPAFLSVWPLYPARLYPEKLRTVRLLEEPVCLAWASVVFMTTGHLCISCRLWPFSYGFGPVPACLPVQPIVSRERFSYPYVGVQVARWGLWRGEMT